MVKHLPFNEFDMAGIKNAVARYDEVGLHAEFDEADKQHGVVTIRFDNPMRTSLWVYFIVHKIAHPSWFGDKAHWVVQLCSQDGMEPEARGCVAAKTQAHALSAAELDLKHGFLSICSFELASAP